MQSEAKVQNLKEMVAYADQSVVSRTIIDKPVATVTLFAFDKGQKLSEHQAPYDALVEVLDGIGEVVIAGEAHRIGAGEMVIMPANVPHAVNAVEKFKMQLVMIRQK